MRSRVMLSRRSFLVGGCSLLASLALAGCASGQATQTASSTTFDSGSPSTSSQASSATSPATGPSSGSAPRVDGGHKVLVAYYSAAGHTRRVAERIADDLDADTFEIVPAQLYSDSDLNFNNDTSRVSREYRDPSLRDTPLSVATPQNWSDYDVVLLGYPIWWMDYAWAMGHFASDNDFTGKTVVPFCTSHDSGMGSSGQNLANLAGTGTWLSGQRFSEDASLSDVDTWVQSIRI